MDSLTISIIQTTGLGVFIWYLIKGLKEQITSLEGVVSAQKQTIEVMDKRNEETEKIGGIYKNLLSNIPSDIDNYKTFISKTRDDVIVELKNQHEDAKKKLNEAQEKIRSTGTNQDQIDSQLKVLKNLLTKQRDKFGFVAELNLKSICEFDGRSIERAVPIILSSSTFESFITNFGYVIVVSKLEKFDSDINKSIFTNKTMPDGTKVEGAMASVSIDGWYAIANNMMWVSEERLSQLKDEFSSVKTYPSITT